MLVDYIYSKPKSPQLSLKASSSPYWSNFELLSGRFEEDSILMIGFDSSSEAFRIAQWKCCPNGWGSTD